MGVTIREPQKGMGQPRMASLLVRPLHLPASAVVHRWLYASYTCCSDEIAVLLNLPRK